MIRKTALVLTLLAGALPATVASATVTLRDKQQAACYNDVQRLCGQFIPDSEKTEACMSKMKEKVSAVCRKYYDD